MALWHCGTVVGTVVSLLWVRVSCRVPCKWSLHVLPVPSGFPPQSKTMLKLTGVTKFPTMYMLVTGVSVTGV